MLNVHSLILFLISVSGISTIVFFITKLILNKVAEAGLEKYKNSLEQEAINFKHNLDLEAENFKHSLNMSATEHQIKFSTLNEKRGIVIAEIHTGLYELSEALGYLTTRWQGPDWVNDTEREEKAVTCYQELKKTFE